MDRGLTVFEISEVKKQPLHQALLQGCNKKSKFIHTQDLKPPIRRCYLRHSEPCCAVKSKIVILLSMFNALSFLSLFQSLSLYCPFERNVHAPSQNVLP
jgi:hypothetical protein